MGGNILRWGIVVLVVMPIFSTPFVYAINHRTPATEPHQELTEVGNTTCPVCVAEIQGDQPVQCEYDGKMYNFCSEECVEAFEEDQEKYIQE